MTNARQPKGDEIVAEKHLVSRYSHVQYEPTPNLSPDFLVDNHIAVEVRGLNQNRTEKGKVVSLEQISLPLNGHFTSLLKSYGPTLNNQSWFVSYSFSRPFNWSTVKSKVIAALNDVKNNPRSEPFELLIHPSFRIHFHLASTPQPELFLLGGSTDLDSGGWILSEFDRNLKICIDQKAAKINQSYKRWWLLLVDHIAFALSKTDREEFMSFFNYSHPWEKIIIIDPYNPNNFFEIQS